MRSTVVLVLSVVIMVVLLRTGAVQMLLDASVYGKYIGSFVAGMFFVSVLTVVPAAAALVTLAHERPLWEIALVGGAGAMLGDLIIFRIVRDAVSEKVRYLIQHQPTEFLKHLLRAPRWRLAGIIVGMVIVASPLPDELGLALMGLERARWYTVAGSTYLLNAIGIGAVAGIVSRFT